MRVWEDGGSECCSIMGQIGVESSDDSTPRESGPTSIWSLIATQENLTNRVRRKGR